MVNKDQKGNKDLTRNEGIFLGYSSNKRSYIVFNSRSKDVMESTNMVTDDSFTNTEKNVTNNDETSSVQTEKT